MSKRRQFGYIRKLKSGKYQASYIGPDGTRENADDTFKNKTAAGKWLSRIETDLADNKWIDPKAGLETFDSYARSILRDSPKIGDNWRVTCERNMRLHMVPLLDLPLKKITSVVVRKWHAEALRGPGGNTSISQAYRFLRMVMNHAVREELIAKNPCNIPGAGVVNSAERPIATPKQIIDLVEAITPRYRSAVLIASWCGLRRGEITGLRRDDVDLSHQEINIRKNRIEPLTKSVKAKDKDPKGKAGKRTVVIPPHVVPIVKLHLDEHAGPERFFVSRDGSPLRGNTLYQAFVRARKKTGLDHLTVHDLRHTGNTLAASAGATMADLMQRLGHTTMNTSKRYLHAVNGRDREIAKALSHLASHGDPAKLPTHINMQS